MTYGSLRSVTELAIIALGLSQRYFSIPKVCRQQPYCHRILVKLPERKCLMTFGVIAAHGTACFVLQRGCRKLSGPLERGVENATATLDSTLSPY